MGLNDQAFFTEETHVATYRPSLSNRLAGLVVTPVFLFVGSGTLAFVARDLWTRQEPRGWDGGFSWFLVGLFTALGSMALLFGVLLVKRTRLVWSFRLDLYHDGLTIVDHTGMYVFAWSDLVEIVEHVDVEYLYLGSYAPGIGIRAPFGKSRHLIMQRTDGTRYVVGPEQVPTIRELLQAVYDATERYQVPWSHTKHDPGPIRSILPLNKWLIRRRDD